MPTAGAQRLARLSSMCFVLPTAVGLLVAPPLTGMARAGVETCTQVQDVEWSGESHHGPSFGGPYENAQIKPFQSGCGTLVSVKLELIGHNNTIEANLTARNTTTDTPSAMGLKLTGNHEVHILDLDLTSTINLSASSKPSWPAGSNQSNTVFSNFGAIPLIDNTPAAGWTGTSDLDVEFEFFGNMTADPSPVVPYTVSSSSVDFRGTLRVTYTYERETTPPVVTITGAGGTLPCNPSTADIDAAVAATATDNCPNVTLNATDVVEKSGPCNGTIKLTRTWTATDQCGNTSSPQSQTVTYTVDDHAPVITATGTTLTLSCNPSAADIDAALGSATAEDDCSGEVTATPTDDPPTVVGCQHSQTRNWSATDACQNTGTASRTVTWSVDVSPVTFEVSGATPSLGCSPSQADIEAAFGTLTTNSVCDYTATATDDPVSSDGCTRSQTREWAVSSLCGGNLTVKSTVSWTVSTSAPTIVASGTPADGVLGCNPSAADIEAALGSATASNDCGSVTPTVTTSTVTSDGCSRTQTRTWDATACGQSAPEVTRTVTWTVDTQGPTVSAVTASTQTLWPPNHTLRDVALTYTASDDCPGSLTTSVSVTSNEPLNGTGDGDTSPDWVVVDDHHVKLRAERAGTGSGRIYTVTVTAVDKCGNTSKSSTTVVVAHNISGPASGNAFKVNTPVVFAGAFWDVPGAHHTAQWTYDALSSVGTVIEPSGLKPGTVTGKYTFPAAGIYKVTLNLADQYGAKTWVNTAGDLEAIVVVYDPSAGYTVGGGWFASPAGAVPAAPGVTGKVSFGFTSKYFKNASNPRGELQFEFKQAGLEFNALSYDYLVIAGAKAQFKGSGKLNGGGLYDFVLTVIDGQVAGGGGTDRVRMKIWNRSTRAVIYDSQPGASDAADPALAVGAGSSVVITGTAATGPAALAQGTDGGATPEIEAALPREYGLSAARPNPFRTTTELHYALPVRSQMELSVYDIRGARVRSLVDAVEEPGARSVRFDSGALEAGVYFVRMRARSVDDPARSFSDVRKMLMVK